MKQSFINFMFRNKKINPIEQTNTVEKTDNLMIEELEIDNSKSIESQLKDIIPVQQDVYELYFDGCSKGNPGLAGAGAVIYKNNQEIYAKAYFVGKKETNNTAEYTGLIIGLTEAVKRNIKNITVKGDSLLVIKQMNGEYKVKADNMKELYETAKNLEKLFDKIRYSHVYRNFNKRADELSNIALMQTFI